MYDIKSLQDALNTNVTNTVTTGLQDQLNKIIAWIVIPTLVLTVAIIVIYVVHMLRRRKIENAILEIRDTLRDMKLAEITLAQPGPVAKDISLETKTSQPVDAITETTA